MGNDQAGGSSSSAREGQGPQIAEMDSTTHPATPGAFNYYEVLSYDDPPNAMDFDDGAGSVCPDGGVVYLRNVGGAPIPLNHMNLAPTATAFPFYLYGAATVQLQPNTTIGFQRDDNLSAWVQMWPLSEQLPISAHIDDGHSPYNVPIDVGYVYVTASMDAMSVVLPSAAEFPNRKINVKLIALGLGGSVDITSAVGDVDGIATFSISNAMESVYFASDGFDWWIISHYVPGG